ncbi:MAG: PASTA domain-containing protein [Calditrichia bacterium]
MQETPKKKRGIFNLVYWKWAGISAVVLIVLVFLFDMAFMPWYTRHGDEYELPDVTLKQKTEALKLLKEKGFKPIIQDSVYKSEFNPGQIIQQNPLPFTKVKKGRRVYLIYCKKEENVSVPNLIGLTRQEAEIRLKAVGLKNYTFDYDFNAEFHKEVVFEQSISDSVKVPPQTPISFKVSLGPRPSDQKVPDLVGKSFLVAKKELELLGIPLGLVRELYRPNLVPGTVLIQRPEPGRPITEADSIRLMISTDVMPTTEDENDTIQ